MKDKSKLIFKLIVGILIISLGYNLYQQNKLNNYQEELTYRLRYNIQKFTSYGGNIEDEVIYAEKYASIVAAHEVYMALSDNNGILSEEWEYSLPGLFISMKDVMINEKEKFNKVFSEDTTAELMFKISDNFEDKESINKVYKLLN